MQFRARDMVLFAVSVLALAGCISTPAPKPIESQELPREWSSPVVAGVEVWPKPEWWRTFGNAELDGLIVAARTNNLDLAQAAARVLQAQAQVKIVRASLFPTLGVGGNVQRQGAVEGGSSSAFNVFALGLQASYEADFWGLARANVRAAQATLKSTLYSQEIVALTVTSAVAANFLTLVAVRERLALARGNLETAQRVLMVIEQRFANGLSSSLDLARQQALVAGQQAQIPPLQQAERETVYTLALLLGRSPGGLSVNAQSVAELSIPPIAPGLPSELLQRRPDLAAAEAGLLAAHANVDAARAAFLPRIALTGNAGVASGALSVVTDNLAGGAAAAAGGTGLLYGIGISLLQTIFDAGRRQGVRELASSQELELIAAYRSVVFNAFSDVETALGQASAFSDEERFKSEQVDKASRALDISVVQYREGLIDLLALLQTQQTLFSAQDELAQIRLARTQAIVGLYRALGGGWEIDREATLANEK